MWDIEVLLCKKQVEKGSSGIQKNGDFLLDYKAKSPNCCISLWRQGNELSLMPED